MRHKYVIFTLSYIGWLTYKQKHEEKLYFKPSSKLAEDIDIPEWLDVVVLVEPGLNIHNRHTPFPSPPPFFLIIHKEFDASL